MPILNFKKEFRTLILNGEKRQTVRALRKYPIQLLDKLYLYTGLRTKNADLLMKVICVETSTIQIDISTEIIRIVVDNKDLDFNEMVQLAKADGFNGLSEFTNFIKENHTIPFKGQIIKW